MGAPDAPWGRIPGRTTAHNLAINRAPHCPIRPRPQISPAQLGSAFKLADASWSSSQFELRPRSPAHERSRVPLNARSEQDEERGRLLKEAFP